jgi:hypothetical protein
LPAVESCLAWVSSSSTVFGGVFGSSPALAKRSLLYMVISLVRYHGRPYEPA